MTISPWLWQKLTIPEIPKSVSVIVDPYYQLNIDALDSQRRFDSDYSQIPGHLPV
jgi:hypothetical protein